MFKKRSARNLVVFILVVLFIFVGCTKENVKQNSNSSENSENTQKKDSLIYAISGEPSTLDTAMATDMIGFTVAGQMFDKLIAQKADGTLEPGLAESWTLNDVGDEITLKLREGVKFHNGEIMTSEDVVFSIQRAIESTYTKSVTSNMESIEAIDGKTVKLKMKTAYAPVESCLSYPGLHIVSKKAYEADPKGFGRNPVGTGPYKFVKWNNGESIIMERFDDYYQGPANIKNLTFKIMTDLSTAAIALETGDIDFLSQTLNSDKENLSNNPNLRYYETQSSNTVFVTFNHEKGLFSNKKMREAVYYGIDKEAVLLGGVEGQGVILQTPMAPACFGWPEDYVAKQYDLEKAKQLLKEAGYNGQPVVLKTMESPTYYKPTEVLQDQLKQMGIDAEIVKMERGAWLADVSSKNANFEIVVASLASAILDSDWLYAYYHSSMINVGNNHYKVNIPELDEALNNGRITQDKEKRKEYYRQVCKIMDEESVIVPLYAYFTAAAANKDLKGVVANPKNLYRVYDFSW